MSTILLIDDDKSLLRVTEVQLQEAGFEVVTANTGLQGWKLFESGSADLILTDINMPGIDGLELIRRIRKQNELIPVIIMTAYGSLDNAIQSTRSGADDYLTKPFSFDTLSFAVNKALHHRNLHSENTLLRQTLYEKYAPQNIIGQSAAMKEVLAVIEKLAATDATVLILGESGTGKELVARALHVSSRRSDKPFVAVNCASIPDQLMESELFGHAKGAFTGAIRDHQGKFEAAQGGTLFLDEIGDLNLDLQSKLLRVLQEHEIQRVGENTVRKIDVRILAATHRKLDEMVAAGDFRQDLYYRLNVIPVTIPPLRERQNDIPLLIHHFVQQLPPARQVQFSDRALQQMVAYHWPGNVRELENLVERMTILNSGKEIESVPLPGQVPAATETNPNTLSIPLPEKGIAFDAIEKQVLTEVLDRFEGNQSKAARYLKMPRHVLIYRMKKHQL